MALSYFNHYIHRDWFCLSTCLLPEPSCVPKKDWLITVLITIAILFWLLYRKGGPVISLSHHVLAGPRKHNCKTSVTQNQHKNLVTHTHRAQSHPGNPHLPDIPVQALRTGNNTSDIKCNCLSPTVFGITPVPFSTAFPFTCTHKHLHDQWWYSQVSLLEPSTPLLLLLPPFSQESSAVGLHIFSSPQ